MRAAVLLTAAALTLCVAGCGSGSTPSAAPPAAPAVPADPAAEDPVTNEGCPLSAEDLSSATGLTWTLRATQPDHELETLPGVTADVCVLTSDDRPQLGGDPLVLRVDAADGAAAEQVRAEFDASCSRNGGTPTPSSAASGARTCEKGSSVPEGLVDGGDRVVQLYYVTADEATSEELDGSFEKVLAAVR